MILFSPLICIWWNQSSHMQWVSISINLQILCRLCLMCWNKVLRPWDRSLSWCRYLVKWALLEVPQLLTAMWTTVCLISYFWDGPRASPAATSQKISLQHCSMALIITCLLPAKSWGYQPTAQVSPHVAGIKRPQLPNCYIFLLQWSWPSCFSSCFVWLIKLIGPKRTMWLAQVIVRKSGTWIMLLGRA